MRVGERVALRELLVALESGSRPKGGVKGIESGVPSLGGEHLDANGGFRLDRVRYVPREFAASMRRGRIAVGDVLVVKDGATTGKVALVRDSFPHEDAVVNEHVFLCRCDERVDPRYVFWYLFSAEGQRGILSDFRGAAQGGISQRFADLVQVPLRPIGEQREIVAEIEKQFSRLDEAVANLKRVKANLIRFEKAVLRSMVVGESNQHRDRSNLPSGWELMPLPELGELSRGKSRHRPRDDPRLYGGPYPFVQTGDVRHSGGVIREFSQTYSDFGLSQSRLWPEGTLCITIAANIAETGILAMPACFPDSVVGFLSEDRILTRFVELFMRTAREELERFAPATAQKNINLAVLERVLVPLPPAAERERIVAEVDRRFSIVREVEAEVDANLKRAQALRQAVLARAFAAPGESGQ